MKVEGFNARSVEFHLNFLSKFILITIKKRKVAGINYDIRFFQEFIFSQIKTERIL